MELTKVLGLRSLVKRAPGILRIVFGKENPILKQNFIKMLLIFGVTLEKETSRFIYKYELSWCIY